MADRVRPGALRPVAPASTRRRRSPFAHLAVRRRRRIEAWAALPRDFGASGFVLHLSRWGSTLRAQALARDPSDMVLSEPGPVSAVLRAPLFGPASEEVATGLGGTVKAWVAAWRAGPTGLAFLRQPTDRLDTAAGTAPIRTAG